MTCIHERWQYCRRVFSDGTIHVGVQCLDCLSCIKLERHGNKLWLPLVEIPKNAPIHAWIDPDKESGQGGLFND